MNTQLQTFWLEKTNRIRRWLRRYNYGDNEPCADHDAMVFLDDVEGEENVTGDRWDHADIRWPKVCPNCHREFGSDGYWQLFCNTIYRRSDTGDFVTLRDVPDGATWDATWMHDCKELCGTDGRCIVCKLPGGHHWMIDSRASNCTRQDDKIHKCWCRHGTPEKCDLTVDKNGDTCSAGAGSIVVPGWHGFLRAGRLESC